MNGSITLAITPKTSTMDQGQSLLFVATLGNDTRNLGVTWQPLTGSGCAGTELRHLDQHHRDVGHVYRSVGTHDWH